MALTVGGLKLWLWSLKANDNDLIVLAQDAEGNVFSPLGECSVGIYHPHNAASGEVTAGREPNRSDEAQEKEPDCIVLWPVN